MRRAFVAATIASALLSACGGPKAGPANNAQANMSEATSSPATAPGDAVQVSMTPVDKATAAQVMHQRHEGMEALGKAAKSMKRTLDATPVDQAALQQAAAPLLSTTAAKMTAWFPAGTGPDVGKTGAKPDIWQHPDDFAEKARDYEAAAKALSDSLRTNNPDEIKAKFASLGGTCKACHDKYRAEMHH